MTKIFNRYEPLVHDSHPKLIVSRVESYDNIDDKAHDWDLIQKQIPAAIF